MAYSCLPTLAAKTRTRRGWATQFRPARVGIAGGRLLQNLEEFRGWRSLVFDLQSLFPSPCSLFPNPCTQTSHCSSLARSGARAMAMAITRSSWVPERAAEFPLGRRTKVRHSLSNFALMERRGALPGRRLLGQTHLRARTSAGRIDILRGGLPPLDYDTVEERAIRAGPDGAEFLVAGLSSIVGFKRLAGRPQTKTTCSAWAEIHGELPTDPIPGLDT